MQGRNPIMLKMESNNYRRETATAVSDIIAEGAVGAVPGTETCAACQRTFTRWTWTKKPWKASE